MKNVKFIKILTLVLGAIAGTVAVDARANEISYFSTVYGTDWVTAGVGGMRNSGVGSLSVSGVTGPVTQSSLYWHGPTNSVDLTANANVKINGTALTGVNIGLSQDNYWGYANSHAYRADSTAVIAGNGTYALSEFAHPDVNINGAATAVFFNDGNTANNRDVVVFDGNDANFVSSYDPAGWDFTLSGINYSGGSVLLRLIVSDGQSFDPFDDGTLRVNGVSVAAGGMFQGVSLPGPDVYLGNLFDIVTIDITSLLGLGANSLRITLDEGFGDAVGAVAAFVDLPAGAAPVSVPEPGSLASVCAALVGLAFAGRRGRSSRRG